MNWNSLSYKKKNQVLAVGYVLFLCIVYKLAISKTVELYVQNADLTEKLTSYQKDDANHEDVVSKKKALENHIASYFVDSISHQDLLIETISNYCHRNHILLKELPAMTKYQEGEFEVGTYKIVLEGTYLPLLKLVHLLEKNNSTGRVSSVLFNLKHDNKRKKDILTLSVYIQNIQKQIHETNAL